MRKLSLKALVSLWCLFLFSAIMLGGCSLSKMQGKTEGQRITKEELKPLLDDPDTIVVDYRLQMHWEKSDQQIRGAVHENPFEEVASWSSRYPKDKHIILY